MTITYTTGDATHPRGSETETKIIAHICNDIGAWGAGFVVALSKRWALPQIAYSKSFHPQRSIDPGYPKLGDVQFIDIPRIYTVGEGRIIVANMIAQSGIGKRNGIPPIRYDALEKCLNEIADHVSAKLTVSPSGKNKSVSVHMPRIGTGLAGGTWDKIEPLILWSLVRHGIPVTVYDLPKRRS